MRLHSLDSLKIIAAFCIVVVHSGTFPEFGYLGGGLFENCTRWALPFFFLASGYMLGNAQLINVGKKVNKLIGILFWTSIIYLPLILIKSIVMHDSFIHRVVNLQTFFGGVYFHLWFVISLIIAFLLTNYFVSNLKKSSSLIICCSILILCWISDLLRSCGIGNDEFYLFRMLMGTALVFIGYTLAKGNNLIKLNKNTVIFIIIFGFFLILFESLISYYLAGSEIHERQFPLGAIFISLGLLIYGAGHSRNKESMFSRCGAKYSLGIYLLHPFILTFTFEIFRRLGVIYSLPNLLIAFFGSLIFICFVEKYFVWFFNKINGIGVK